ncbi:MAG TPA: Xaa-Pro dipeptidase [Steroidobacteraceae bacterium]|nr:Xaa-Pro dipeptidase [Steroidobacteraceae bacterium]
MTAAEPQRNLQRSLASTFGPHIQAVCDRTAHALASCGYAGMLVYAGSPLPVFEDDRTYPFEANAPFKVWVPLSDAPGSFVWFAPGSPPRLIIERPEDYWYRPPSLPQGYWVRHFEVHTVADRAAARALLPADLSRAAYIGDAFDGLDDFRLGAINPRPLLRRLDYARAAKTPYELVCLREASRLGALGHVAAAAAFAAGASEFEIELAFLEACGLREQELPYNPIIALNASAAVLHYQVLEKAAPLERHSLLIDAGAEFAGYACDITRTYAGADREFGTLIARMDEMQQRLCADVRAGVDWRDVQQRAHELTAEVLRDGDLIRCSAASAVGTGVTRVFLPHGIGHLLGLEVHDVGGLMRTAEGGEIERPEGHPYLRLTRVLEAGFVVTMEPGIYFIPQLLEAARADGRGRHINWSRVEALAHFGGIRIEDDLAVTATGCENLTRDAFRSL